MTQVHKFLSKYKESQSIIVLKMRKSIIEMDDIVTKLWELLEWQLEAFCEV